MEFVIIGAGAVGAVVGTLLEHAGHGVCYWARAGQAQSTEPFIIERDGGDTIRSQSLRWIDARTSPMPASDYVLVCVRTEQLSAALAQVVEHLGGDRAVAIATVTLDGSVAAAREAGLRGPVLAFHVSFGSGFLPNESRRLAWFPFTPPSTISPEGQGELVERARALAGVLATAGLPTRFHLDMSGMMRLMVASNIALLPAWELCGWDIAKLARDPELRELTARAMHETARQFAPASGPAHAIGRALPLFVYAMLLRVLPWLMGMRARKLWLIHGPKVGEQTRYVLHDLLARAKGAGVAVPHLAKLTSRWEEGRNSDLHGSASARTFTVHP
jgi:ketopantoate reductase